MSVPGFPRQFKFELPLFKNEKGPQSPWRNVVSRLKPAELNKRQVLATYDILRRFSQTQLAKYQAKRDQLIAGDQQGSVEFQELQKTIERQEKAFHDGGGGAAQFPFINYDEFSFPIYPTQHRVLSVTVVRV